MSETKPPFPAHRIVALIMVIWVIVIMGIGLNNLVLYIDAPSFILTIVPVLAAWFFLFGFGRWAWLLRALWSGRELSAEDATDAETLCQVGRQVVFWVGGLFSTLIGFIGMAWNAKCLLADSENLFRGAAIAFLTLIYAALLIGILHVLEAQARMAGRKHKPEEQENA